MPTREIKGLTEGEYLALVELADGGFRYHGLAGVTPDSHNAKVKLMAAIIIPDPKPPKVKKVAAPIEGIEQ